MKMIEILKIKDDVDWRQLEELGFTAERDYLVYREDEPKTNWSGAVINNLIGIAVNEDYVGVLDPTFIRRGQIVFSNYSFEGNNAAKTMFKMYDLINKGLVEKVKV